MTSIAVLTSDVLGDRMAGPAIRATHIAHELGAAGHDVALLSTHSHSFKQLREAVETADVVVVQGYLTHDLPWVLRSDKVVVVDLYDPLHFEQLEQRAGSQAATQQAHVDLTMRVLNEQLVRGDFFLCASETQRDLWLGHLAAVGRINVSTYAQDPTLRSLIAVCPFGLSPDVPSLDAGEHPLREAFGFGAADRVLLWAGGVYDWLDPLTLIRAVEVLRHRIPKLRLVFQGMAHPNPDVIAMEMPTQVRQLANELDLTGEHVFFTTEWIEYNSRHRYLLDADLGVSTHPDHVETRFAFRTRILDYLWTRLPIVATGGDALAELVRSEGLGAVVPAGDVEALAHAIERLLVDPSALPRARARIELVAPRFTWSVALSPLLDFCAQPSRAADAVLDQKRLIRRPTLPASPVPRLAAKAELAMRRGGVREVVERGSAKLTTYRRTRG